MLRKKALIVEDNQTMRLGMVESLRREGYEVGEFDNAPEALQALQQQFFPLVVTDLKMAPMDGIALLREIKAAWPAVEVLVVSAFGTVDVAVQAMRLGAADFLTKPFSTDELRERVKKVWERILQKHTLDQLLEEKRLFQDEMFGEMIGNSPVMRQLFALIQRVAREDSTILIEGESGTGKELAARAIHRSSPRAEQPFIKVNCGALNDNLLESELFGHEKGAFTGAIRRKKGRFELAHGGTLFLDEIGEMPLAMQVKLLRALETGRFRRVGGTETLKSNVRIVCATNRSLLDCVHYGHFRGDLYYRIATFPVTLPPLRDRKEDLAELSEHLLAQSSSLLGEHHTLAPEAVDKLATYDFPGNVRELRNLLQRAATMSVGGIITARDLELPKHEDAPEEEVSLEDVEARYINELLHRHNGRRAEVAKVLSISERTLYRKLKRFGINDKQFASG